MTYCRAMKVICSLILLLLALTTTVVAQRSPKTSEVHRLFLEDQKDREGPMSSLDWSKINPRDKARRQRIRELMSAGEIKSGQDFHDAAFIFQHGEATDDYLLAHILAVAGLANGDKECLWIAAATLDRYLHKIKQPQVFGTQFDRKDDATPWTQEPFNRDLLASPLRVAFCVPAPEAQRNVLESLNKNEDPKWPASPCK